MQLARRGEATRPVLCACVAELAVRQLAVVLPYVLATANVVMAALLPWLGVTVAQAVAAVSWWQAAAAIRVRAALWLLALRLVP